MPSPIPDPLPTPLEWRIAQAVLAPTAVVLVFLMLVPFWFLYEAAAYGAVRHHGAWVSRADSLSVFWLEVGKSIFWAAAGSAVLIDTLRTLKRKGGWNALVAHRIRAWRILISRRKGQAPKA